jgi:NADPH-dependent glutamate synthase beta subunit-like oxidoreductase
LTLVKSLFSNINTAQQCAINAKRKTIAVNEKMQSSISSAGGNIVRGGATVIFAMGDGRKAAASMCERIEQVILN